MPRTPIPRAGSREACGHAPSHPSCKIRVPWSKMCRARRACFPTGSMPLERKRVRSVRRVHPFVSRCLLDCMGAGVLILTCAHLRRHSGGLCADMQWRPQFVQHGLLLCEANGRRVEVERAAPKTHRDSSLAAGRRSPLQGRRARGEPAHASRGGRRRAFAPALRGGRVVVGRWASPPPGG